MANFERRERPDRGVPAFAAWHRGSDNHTHRPPASIAEGDTRSPAGGHQRVIHGDEPLTVRDLCDGDAR